MDALVQPEAGASDRGVLLVCINHGVHKKTFDFVRNLT